MVMNERRETKNGRLKFYHLHWSRDESFFTKGDKIISVRKCESPTFVYTSDEAYFMMSCNIIKSTRINLKYLTGILNSKLIKFWLLKKGKMQGDIYQVDKEPLLDIPIHKTLDKELETQIITLVDKIVKAKVSTFEADNEHDKDFFLNYSKTIESEIDNLVYKLYDISNEEQDTIKSLLK
jgi:adenine-specific DNA-methyltransferase